MSNQLDITFNFNSDNEPEKLKAKLSFLDPELIGKEATFTIENHVNVNASRPVDKSDTLFTQLHSLFHTGVGDDSVTRNEGASLHIQRGKN